MVSSTEENYLKAIFKIGESEGEPVSTNAISHILKTKAASVTDMIKKLADKKLVLYQKYKGVKLTAKGKRIAMNLIRNHRLWEVFLVQKLNFKWDEVHPIAEELEHIRSELLTGKLEEFLGFPKFDPHGDPIPDAEGNMYYHKEFCISDLKVGNASVVVGVKDSSKEFLRYLDKLKIKLGSEVKLKEIFDYDGTREVLIDGNPNVLSDQVCKNLYIQKEVS